MPGMEQDYRCTACGYQGTAESPANAAEEVLLEAARSDHAEQQPDCSEPRIALGSQSPGA